ncbi:MAG: DUF6046 domain-containing protein [Bacteroidales bacterium]|nr:DUF6046 domain-containing protein [Bacteroidales bacterium]
MIKINLIEVYKEQFGEPYRLSNLGINMPGNKYKSIPDNVPQVKTQAGLSLTVKNNFGKDIFAPLQFFKNSENYLQISCATIKVSSKKTIIKTAVSERNGTIKEQFNVGDYQFVIKGVLIGTNNQFPEEKIRKLRELYETVETIELYNAFTELFMDKYSRKISIESIDFPEVKGMGLKTRPFVMTCESDFIDTLIIT